MHQDSYCVLLSLKNLYRSWLILTTSIPIDNSLHVFALDEIFINRKSNFAKWKAEDIQLCTVKNCPYLKEVAHIIVQE